MRFRWFRRESAALTGLIVFLHAITLILLILQILRGQWSHAGLCALSLALYSLPRLLGALFRAEIPPLLEGIALCFAAAANLGGEMQALYLRLPFWDSALHILWGFLAAAIGYAMPDLLERREGVSRSLPSAAGALLALSFAMLTAVLWEFFEYGMDALFGMDMQKDRWIGTVASVLLEPEGMNRAVRTEIESVLVNGEAWPAFLDIGLQDTMQDLQWTFGGALAAAILLLLKRDGRLPLPLRLLVPRPRKIMEKDGVDSDE
jgi:hypothetical protein